MRSEQEQEYTSVNSSRRKKRMKELTDRQETLLITHLESSFTSLNRNFETRNSPLSTLPTLQLYLETILSLHSIILSIPPLSSSAPLRTAFYLQLISLLPSAFESYPLDPPLLFLWTALATLDNGLLIILNGDSFDRTTGNAGEYRATESETGVRVTDRVRIESVIKDVRQTLGSMLGVIGVGGVDKVDIKKEVMIPSFSNLEEGEATEGTPSLADDTGDSMDGIEEEGGSNSDSDSEFEEVQVAPEDPLAFDIHFEAPPPSILPITEEPHIVRPGFDPDEDFPEEEDLVEELEDDSDETIRRQVERVFEGALERLEAFKL